MPFKSGTFDEQLLQKFDWLYYQWTDHPQNPLVEAIEEGDWVADPAVLLPSESSDSRWHMFCSGRGIKHFVSENGIKWIYKGLVDPKGYSPFVFKGGDDFWLFYETGWNRRLKIVCRHTGDLETWSEERVVLEGEKTWEFGIENEPYVRNPCIVKFQGQYMLYYSGGYVGVLPDAGFAEPAHVCLAISEGLLGPYEKHPEPLISPRFSDQWRNLGAGAMKVYRMWGIFVGFNNGIYWGEDLHSHSAIHVLFSRDGVNWFDSPKNPVLLPIGKGWKRSHVYQLDVKTVREELWMFYNARDGWMKATERIGLATCKIPPEWHKGG